MQQYHELKNLIKLKYWLTYFFLKSYCSFYLGALQRETAYTIPARFF